MSITVRNLTPLQQQQLAEFLHFMQEPMPTSRAEERDRFAQGRERWPNAAALFSVEGSADPDADVFVPDDDWVPM